MHTENNVFRTVVMCCFQQRTLFSQKTKKITNHKFSHVSLILNISNISPLITTQNYCVSSSIYYPFITSVKRLKHLCLDDYYSIIVYMYITFYFSPLT